MMLRLLELPREDPLDEFSGWLGLCLQVGDRLTGLKRSPCAEPPVILAQNILGASYWAAREALRGGMLPRLGDKLVAHQR
jgi:hypothetical protein